MSKQVIIEFPDELPDEIVRDPAIIKEGKTTMVLEMLRKGAISPDNAAALLEINRSALANLMAAHRIPVTGTIEVGPEDPTAATAGAWQGLLDCQTFEEEVYDRRLHPPRPEVRL